MSKFVKEIDLGWKRIQRELKVIDKSFVKIGVISGGGKEKYSLHRDVPSKRAGTKQKTNIDIAQLATIHEFGLPSRRIPARPFIRQAHIRNKGKINRKIATLLNRIYRKMSVRTALEILGLFHQGNTRRIFRSGYFRPNKPATIAAKKSSRPLIDTGRLRQSIDYEVVLK